MEGRVGQLEEVVERVAELEGALQAQDCAAAFNDGLKRGRAEAQRLAAQELERVKASLLDVQNFVKEARRSSERAHDMIEDLRRQLQESEDTV